MQRPAANAWTARGRGEEITEMIRPKNAVLLSEYATRAEDSDAVPRPPKEWPANRLAAQTALQVAARQKAQRRDDLYREVAARVLQDARGTLTTEEDLYVACYQALRGQGRTLWTHDCQTLRAATRLAWYAFDPGEDQSPVGGIEQAATATTSGDSRPADLGGSTAAVRAGDSDMGPPSCSPVAPGETEAAVAPFFALAVSLSRAQLETLSGEVTR